jgi:DNA-binding transcriptional regulator YhcF (GntR family)
MYRQVADEIRALIAGGKLREGVPLPSERQLASDLGVNLNTIATAYGSGTVVTSRTARESSRIELRQPLRNALTHLLLGGLSRSEILNLISTELTALTKGAK